jgi:hypothetical protein
VNTGLNDAFNLGWKLAGHTGAGRRAPHRHLRSRTAPDGRAY